MGEACPPVFVVGAPRSGTTLTARILGRHVDLFMPGETHYFADIAARKELASPAEPAVAREIWERLLTLYGRYNEPRDQERVERLFRKEDYRRVLSARWETHGDVFASFMEEQMRDQGKRCWGNQAPKDLFHLDVIQQHFLDARLVVCLRDPRDFMVSYRDRWKTTRSADRVRMLYHPIMTALMWRLSARRIMALEQAGWQGGLTWVRYEEMVNEPTSTVARLCDALGLPFEQQLLEVDAHNSSREGAGQGIFTSSVGRWRDELPAEDRRILETLAGREMEALGYPPERGGSISSRRMAGIVASFPVRAARAVAATRGHREPLIQYLRNRLFQSVSGF